VEGFRAEAMAAIASVELAGRPAAATGSRRWCAIRGGPGWHLRHAPGAATRDFLHRDNGAGAAQCASLDSQSGPLIAARCRASGWERSEAELLPPELARGRSMAQGQRTPWMSGSTPAPLGRRCWEAWTLQGDRRRPAGGPRSGQGADPSPPPLPADLYLEGSDQHRGGSRAPAHVGGRQRPGALTNGCSRPFTLDEKVQR